jgi:hypothetical protein
MVDLKRIDRDFFPDCMASEECTHVLYGFPHSFWKVEGDRYFKWVGNEQWVEYGRDLND